MTLLDDADGVKTLEAIEETVVPRPQEASIFGIKLLEDDERSVVLLLKFLHTHDLKPVGFRELQEIIGRNTTQEGIQKRTETKNTNGNRNYKL